MNDKAATTKEKLLELLEENRGKYLSGEEIAERLCLSRAAVWKAVKGLRGDGYEISAVTNKGYCLAARTDILSAQGIRKYLEKAYREWDIHILPTVDSTNTHALAQANGGAKEGYTVIAGAQTKGRGRGGRSFFSPDGTGLYMSILLRPAEWNAGRALRITTIAAVAMCEAIEEVSGEKAKIKWVNDIFVRGKKVCGILTEASFGMESGLLEYAVLGVGVNVYPPSKGFPGEIMETAGAVCMQAGDDLKNRLAASFINRFMRDYQAQDQGEYIRRYREYSLVIGKKITVLREAQSRRACVLGIDDACRLQVRYEDGGEDTLSYGEISIDHDAAV